MAQHAILSPSSADRWLHCTVAPRLEQTVPDEGSIFAAEGTLAHAICESKLYGFLHTQDAGQHYLLENKAPWQDHELYNTEMEGYTDEYVDFVKERLMEAAKGTPDAMLHIEVTLDMTQWVPEGFGTGDAVIIADDLMEVIDFKYGKGVEVSAVDNPQMKLYALGAYARFADEYNIKRVRLNIVQPRIYNTSSWEITAEELLAWGESIKPIALRAFKGEGEQAPGRWCKFCAVKAQCRAMADMVKHTACGDPHLLSLDEVAELLAKADAFKSWCTSLEEYALQKAVEGETVPGYKIVEGRSIRKVTDQEGFIKALKLLGYGDDKIFKPKELQTLTALEKVVGKKELATDFAQYIEKPQGKPTLVPESDKRQPLNLKATAENDFSHIK